MNFLPVGTWQFFGHRDYSLYMLWVTKNKVHGAFVFVLVVHSLVLHLVQVSAMSDCTTKGHPVVLSSQKGLNFKGYVVAPIYGYHVCPPWNVSEGMTYQKFLLRETNARFILVVRPFSSFTQTSSESKKIYMAKDSILTVLCLCTSLFRVLQKECNHSLDLIQTWVALNSCQSTIVLHHGFFPDDHHLTNLSYGLDDLVQPLHN